MINKGTILLASLAMLCLEISSNESYEYSSRDDVKEYIKEILEVSGFQEIVITDNQEDIVMFSGKSIRLLCQQTA